MKKLYKPYIISYDLKNPGQKYKDVFEVIKQFGACIKILDSVWLVRTSLTPNEMVDKIHNAADNNDHIFVTEISKKYQGWLDEESWEFIKKNIYI